ncbi:MAG: phosphatidate cytidylyltransferase [Oscillospiraceae bacterium]
MLLTRTIMAAVLIALLLALTLWLPAVWLTAVVVVLTVIGAYELMHATGEARNTRLYVWPALTAAAIPLGFYFGCAEIVLRISLVFLMLVLFSEAIFTYGGEKQVPFSAVLTAFFAGMLVPVCLSSLVSMRLMENGGLIIIMAFVITAVSDTGGYFGGMFFGKHKGVLKTSPNKSVEGFVGSFVLGIVGILIFGLIMDKAVGISVNYGLLVLYAALGNVTTQIGDLAFSVIKRQHGIKDYGKLIPGHGGVLDRFDSMIFTGPLVYLLVTHFPAF